MEAASIKIANPNLMIVQCLYASHGYSEKECHN